ncbi:conserved hypothetical protein [Cupriavidus taiwanensis]|uniref:Uncharacterized protein n=1 Tax=Cupriavidus taiwanensis TaxID=164546 RepID=A0A976A364_9BURK|nr:conserved hypothetical protein [Cupriavidus taiwanensis]
MPPPSAIAASCFWMKLPSRPHQPGEREHAPRSRAFVATAGRACQRRVSTPQRSPAGMPPAGPASPRRARGATRKPLWHNGLRWPGPPLAYARHAVPQYELPQCRRNVRRHRTQNDTGSFTMPVVRQPAMSHRNTGHAAAARGTGSAPFRCMARSGHVQHAARCMHASALRRLQSRNPRTEHGGPGRWPFHACAICAPPCCRVSRR